MNHLAIIPARSGSKSLRDKNILPLNGKPLIAYSIEAARASGVFSEVLVSTDSPRYADIARSCGANVPFLRSETASSDTASSWDVAREVLRRYSDIGRWFDSVCLLQPTSPLREPEDIVAGYEAFHQKNADAITAVCEMDHSPLWATTLDSDLSLAAFRKTLMDLPRQMLKPFYRINGALYIRRIRYGENEIEILEKREYAYIMDRRKSVDIDTLEDFEYAAYLFGKKNPDSPVRSVIRPSFNT